MRKPVCAAMILCIAIFFAGCGGTSAPQANATAAESVSVKATEDMKMNVVINGKTFTAVLENNDSARAFAKRLPLTVEMTELNGNEKYYRLPERLPADDIRPKEIRAGDLMLYGGSYVVLFYKDFSTSYSYTRLGKIEDADGLADALGGGDVRVRISY